MLPITHPYRQVRLQTPVLRAKTLPCVMRSSCNRTHDPVYSSALSVVLYQIACGIPDRNCRVQDFFYRRTA